MTSKRIWVWTHKVHFLSKYIFFGTVGSYCTVVAAKYLCCTRYTAHFHIFVYRTNSQPVDKPLHPSKQTVVDYFTQVVAEIWFMKFGTCKLSFGLVKNLLLFQSEEPLWPLFDWLTENMCSNTFQLGLYLRLFCLLTLTTWVLIVKYLSFS